MYRIKGHLDFNRWFYRNWALEALSINKVRSNIKCCAQYSILLWKTEYDKHLLGAWTGGDTHKSRNWDGNLWCCCFSRATVLLLPLTFPTGTVHNRFILLNCTELCRNWSVLRNITSHQGDMNAHIGFDSSCGFVCHSLLDMFLHTSTPKNDE